MPEDNPNPQPEQEQQSVPASLEDKISDPERKTYKRIILAGAIGLGLIWLYSAIGGAFSQPTYARTPERVLYETKGKKIIFPSQDGLPRVEFSVDGEEDAEFLNNFADRETIHVIEPALDGLRSKYESLPVQERKEHATFDDFVKAEYAMPHRRSIFYRLADHNNHISAERVKALREGMGSQN
jgi:hypothetical protein